MTTMEKHTIEEVRDIIETEGLGYAVQDYMSAESIADETLAHYWKKASEYLNKITDYVEENAKPEFDEEEDDD